MLSVISGSSCVEECDVVCIGSGAGGLTAALVAAEHGLRAVVVEKSKRLGGVTAWSAGQVWVGANHLAGELGIIDSIADAAGYLSYLSGGLEDRALARCFLTRADEALRFLRERADVELQVIRGFPDYYYGKTATAKPEGRYLEAPPFPLSRLGAFRERFVEPIGVGHGLASSADLVASGGASQSSAQPSTSTCEPTSAAAAPRYRPPCCPPQSSAR